MMTPRQDLLDHAVDLFPAPEGSAADVQRDVARRHRNRRLGAAAVVIAIWVAIGVALTASRPDDSVPMQSPTPTPSPTVAPGSVDARGWPSMGRNHPGVYSWDGSTCETHSCAMGWIHGGGGGISILVYGTADVLEPHEGTPVTIFGYEGSYLAGIPGESFTTGGRRASCEQWMVDIQGTTVTVKVCAKPGVPEARIRAAHRIIRSMRVEPRDSDLGFRLVFTLTTNTWDSG